MNRSTFLFSILLYGLTACMLFSQSAENDRLPLTLEEAIGFAEAESGELERARIAVEQAHSDIAIARADHFPQIRGAVSASYLFSPPQGVAIDAGAFGAIPDPGTGTPSPIPDSSVELIPEAEPTFFSVSASLEQVLYTWGKVSEGVRVAGYERDALQRELLGSRVGLVSEVRNAYFSARLGEDTAEALRKAEDVVNRIVEDRQEALDAGTGTLEEVLEMRAEAASVRRRRISAEQGTGSALRALSLLIGRDAGGHALVTPYGPRETGRPPLASESALLDEAIGFSPDLHALRNRMGAAEGALRITGRTNRLRYPDIALSLDFEASGQRMPFENDWQDRWDTDLTLTIATRFTIFDGGAQAARIRRAEADLRSLQTRLSDARDGVQLAFRQAYERFLIAGAEYDEASARLDYVAERRRNAQVSYENDRITREQMLSTRLQEIATRIDRDSAAFSLETALGEIESLTGAALEGR